MPMRISMIRPMPFCHGVCGIVKAVYELEAKCDQKRNEEEINTITPSRVDDITTLRSRLA
jgi:hypothetical protein